MDNDPRGLAQGHDCVESQKLLLHTPATISARLARLATSNAELSRRDFAELQTRLGWNYVPEGLLLDAQWKDLMCPSKVCLYDWLHVWLVGGVFNIHMGLMMQFLKQHAITYQSLHAYASLFHWPAAVKGRSGADASKAHELSLPGMAAL